MASKQLGKLRQWAGEVISSREKSTVTDEFRELEHDVELRKEGLLKLHAASDAYHRALSKKKDSDALGETEKLLAIDALGIVMISHGEEFGEDSVFGTSLVKFGRAHSKVATLQEAYALTFQDTFLASIRKFEENIKDYEHQRKKLESRRLSYDAAISKLDKVTSSKKEKDRKEAENELQTARLRYEETSEDVRARARAIQENEIQQLRDLTTFLDTEMNFVQQYFEVLQDVKSSWCDESYLTTAEISREHGPTHIFTRSTDGFKVESGRSKRSARSSRSNVIESSEGSSDEGDSPQTPNRKSFRRHPSSSGKKSQQHSRSASIITRKRSDSGATSAGTDKEKDKTEKAAKRLSVPGWASSAVSSVTGRGKKDKEQFANLTDDEGDNDRGNRDIRRSPSSSSFTSKKQLKKKSKESMASASPKTPIRILRAPSRQEKKIVRALYDFTGATDELTFKAGDEIMVLNEVLEGWWMGELLGFGKKGLFPTQYTDAALSTPTQPPFAAQPGRVAPSLSSPDDSTRFSSGYVNGYITSDPDDDHLFADQSPTSGRSPQYGQFDAGSITDSATDGEEKRLMPPRKPSEDDDDNLHLSSNQNVPKQSQPPIFAVSNINEKHISVKKAPPPPPPRRSTGNLLAPPPPIPDRRPTKSRSQSSASITIPTPTSSVSSFSQDVSPFESATEISIADC